MTGKTTVAQIVTDKMIAALEQGTVPWRKPWGEAGMPLNAKSGKPYRGANPFLLSLADYASPYWATFGQWQELGGQVRKGETSTLITFWKRYLKAEDGESEPKAHCTLRYFRVFNACQVDGLPAKYFPIPAAGGPQAHGKAGQIADDYFARRGAPRRQEGPEGAWYRPSSDVVHTPPLSSYGIEDQAEYYSTLFHEIAHSTGHTSRLNRDTLTGHAHFGSAMYSKEELVAEMTASILCATSGVETPASFSNSAAYISGWLRQLRDDPQLVISAAAKASQAADFALGRDYGQES